MKKTTCPDCKGWRYKFEIVLPGPYTPSDRKDDRVNKVTICKTCKGNGFVEEINQPVRSVHDPERAGSVETEK